MKRAILPTRPMRLRRGRFIKNGSIAFAIAAVAVALAAGGVYAASDVLQISRDQEIWERGIAADGSIEGKRKSRLGMEWLMAHYQATVRYRDAEGAQFEGTVEFMTMFGGPDTSAAVVRYDPRDHSRFAISWAVEASGARYRGAIGWGLVFALLATALLYGCRMIIRTMRAQAQIGREGDEVELAVLASRPVIKDGRPTGNYEYTLQLVDGEISRTIVTQAGGLLFCAPNEARALGLWRTRDAKRVLVIERDLTPLVVTEAERDEIRERAERACRAS